MWLGRKAKASEIAALGSVVDGDPFEERLGALVLDADGLGCLEGLEGLDEEATGAGEFQSDLRAELDRRKEDDELADAVVEGL